MSNHIMLLIIFSILASLVFTFIARNGARERIRHFLLLLASFVLLSIIASWMMYPFPL